MADIEKARRVRYRTEAEIETAIDRAKAKVNSLADRAYNADLKATYWIKKWGPKPDTKQRARMLGRVMKNREMAAKLRQRADKIDGGVLTRLKSKLAVMRTYLLPSMGSDMSIPKR